MAFDSCQQIAFKEFSMPSSEFFNLIPQCVHHVPKDVVETKYTQKHTCSSKGFLVSLADFAYSVSTEIKQSGRWLAEIVLAQKTIQCFKDELLL